MNIFKTFTRQKVCYKLSEGKTLTKVAKPFYRFLPKSDKVENILELLKMIHKQQI